MQYSATYQQTANTFFKVLYCFQHSLYQFYTVKKYQRPKHIVVILCIKVVYSIVVHIVSKTTVVLRPYLVYKIE